MVHPSDARRGFPLEPSASMFEFCPSSTSFPELTQINSGNDTDLFGSTGPIDNSDNQSLNSDDPLYDVLPSFHMYNTLHKNIPSGNINADVQEHPPVYGFEDIEPQNSHSVQDDADELVDVEKVYQLPRVSTPIDIDIHITQSLAKPGRKPSDESILREYTNGDVVQGYVITENKSERPIPFEMFYVTLEGHVSIIDKQNNKRVIKRFLRAVDFSASWSYGAISTASGLQYKEDYFDTDNTILGLPNSRMLLPGRRHKKFFTFRFPSQLLDCICPHQTHVSVPPTFGVDREKSHGIYSYIKADPLLGYGYLGMKGSPVVTQDFAGDHLSISYTVDIRIVGRDLSSSGNQLCVLKEREHHLRMMPFGCEEAKKCTLPQLNDLHNQIKQRLGTLETFLDKFERGETLSIVDTQRTAPKQEIQGMRRASRADGKNKKMTADDEDHVVSVHCPYSIVQKRKKLFGSSTAIHSNKTGVITMRALIPDIPLAYFSPSLINKSNQVDRIRNKKNAENLQQLKNHAHKGLESISVHLECTPAAGSNAHDPPSIKSVSMELHALTYRSGKSVPITIDPVFMAEGSSANRLNSEFTQYKEKMGSLRDRFDEEKINQAMQDGKVRFDDFIDPQMRADIESLKSIKITKDVIPKAFEKVTDFGKGWVLDGSSWVKALDLNTTWGPTLISNTIPSFQSCLAGRGYVISLKVVFEGIEDAAILQIPISIGRT